MTSGGPGGSWTAKYRIHEARRGLSGRWEVWEVKSRLGGGGEVRDGGCRRCGARTALSGLTAGSSRGVRRRPDSKVWSESVSCDQDVNMSAFKRICQAYTAVSLASSLPSLSARSGRVADMILVQWVISCD